LIEGVSLAVFGATWTLAFASLAFAGIAVRHAPDVSENHATPPPPCLEEVVHAHGVRAREETAAPDEPAVEPSSEIAGPDYDPGPPDCVVDVRTLLVPRGFKLSPSTRPSARGRRAARNVHIMDALHGRVRAIEYGDTTGPGDTRSLWTTPAQSVTKPR
jgi:hypothetical protein